MKKPSKKETELEKKISQAQKNFVLGYLKHGNGTKAAKEAGYSEKCAHSQASVLLRNPKVTAYMEEVRERMESEKIADITEVMEFFSATMRGQINDQFDLEPALTDRINAGKELLKRLSDKEGISASVTIINNIPMPGDEDG